MSDKLYSSIIKITLALFIFSFIGTPLIMDFIDDPELKKIIILQGNLLINAFYILLVVFFCRKKKITLYDTFKVNFKTGFKRYIVGFLSGVAMMSIVAGILYFSGNASIESESVQKVGVMAIPALLIILTGWIVQSAGEEFLIRGFVMKLMSRRINIFITIFISSILFSAMHLGNPGIGALSLINLTLYGVAMGLYVVKTNDLWGACGNHAAWNFFQGNIFGFEVSGLDVQVGTIVDMNANGNSILNGGIFGPEAGLVCTIVLLVFILIMTILIMKEKSKVSKPEKLLNTI